MFNIMTYIICIHIGESYTLVADDHRIYKAAGHHAILMSDDM